MGVGIDPFLLYCLLIPGSSQGMALPEQGSGFTTSLEWLIYPQVRRKSCDLIKAPTTHYTSLKLIQPELPSQTLSCGTLGSFRLGKIF